MVPIVRDSNLLEVLKSLKSLQLEQQSKRPTFHSAITQVFLVLTIGASAKKEKLWWRVYSWGKPLRKYAFGFAYRFVRGGEFCRVEALEAWKLKHRTWAWKTLSSAQSLFPHGWVQAIEKKRISIAFLDFYDRILDPDVSILQSAQWSNGQILVQNRTRNAGNEIGMAHQKRIACCSHGCSSWIPVLASKLIIIVCFGVILTSSKMRSRSSMRVCCVGCIFYSRRMASLPCTTQTADHSPVYGRFPSFSMIFIAQLIQIHKLLLRIQQSPSADYGHAASTASFANALRSTRNSSTSQLRKLWSFY